MNPCDRIRLQISRLSLNPPAVRLKRNLADAGRPSTQERSRGVVTAHRAGWPGTDNRTPQPGRRANAQGFRRLRCEAAPPLGRFRLHGARTSERRIYCKTNQVWLRSSRHACENTWREPCENSWFQRQRRSISSILYPSGSSTKAITVVPNLTGPASRVTFPPPARTASTIAATSGTPTAK